MPPNDELTTKGALFSAGRVYRYVLWRVWDGTLPMAMLVGLNGSTADEERNDPTIRRAMTFSARWGYGGVYMLNIHGAVSTDPKNLRHMVDPVGPFNDFYLIAYGIKSDIIVLAYGTHGEFMNRGQAVKALFTQAGLGHKLRHLGLTKDGYPKHPLYLRADTLPQEWL